MKIRLRTPLPFRQFLLSALVLSLLFCGQAQARKPASKKAASTAENRQVVSTGRDGEAETRLIEIYQSIGQSHGRDALAKAELLVKDYPNFQLAQLIYGDLLAAQVRPIRIPGDVPDTMAASHAAPLAELREESLLRLKALRERPPAGSLPMQFVSLAANNKHAIAVDTSRSRLYLFENSPTGLKLVADYYVSIGKLGTEKALEGDSRTPLGVYFVTGSLNPKALKEFYGAGALPINYPNPYDLRRGKSGSGIWLHGTPPALFARGPRATDGCVVLANPDLQRLLSTVEARNTPVVIAPSLQWVPTQNLRADSQKFENVLQTWRQAKSSGNLNQVLDFYAPDFSSYGKNLAAWSSNLGREVDKARGLPLQLKDLSLLRWNDQAETMVVTFTEVLQGAKGGSTKRQYWLRQTGQWKIFFEGVIS
jgi:L,D-transpeptidase YnhG